MLLNAGSQFNLFNGNFNLFLFGIREFVSVLVWTGTGVGVFEGLVIIALFAKAKQHGTRTPEYSFKIPGLAFFLLSLVLIGGALAAIIF